MTKRYTTVPVPTLLMQNRSFLTVIRSQLELIAIHLAVCLPAKMTSLQIL